jgi:molecular chaperone DnaK (HSP70)
VSGDSEAPVLARIGDEVPIVLGNRAHSAHYLAAAAVVGIIDEIAAEEGAPAEHIVVTHPPGWGPYRTDLLHQALCELGLDTAVLVPEPVAAAVGASARHRIDSSGMVGVYDLGGSRVTATVVRRAGGVGFEVVGRPETADNPAGADFDDALVAMVTDAEAQATWEDMAQLRSDCVAGKQALSTLPEVTIMAGREPVTRPEFEEAILPAVTQGVEVLVRAVLAAGITTDQLSAVVLVGGSARIPLVRRVIGDRLRRPVLVDQAPDATIAVGAATIATWAAPAQVDRSAAVEETMMMPPLPEETLILFPSEDLDLRPEPESDEQPVRPPVDVPSPKLGPPPRPRRRRKRRMTLRGTVICAGTATLLFACGYLVQQNMTATPPASPPPVSATHGAGGR